MTLDKFVDYIDATGSDRPELDRLFIYCTGLAGEVGEVLEHFKKSHRDHKVLNLQELSLELGDVINYWTRICRMVNLNPEDILQANVDKLNERRKNDKEKKFA